MALNICTLCSQPYFIRSLQRDLKNNLIWTFKRSATDLIHMTRESGQSIIHTVFICLANVFQGLLWLICFSYTDAHTHKSCYAVTFLWIRTNSTLSQREGERSTRVWDDGQNLLFVMMCSSRLRDDSIMTKHVDSFHHRSTDLLGYDLSWQLNKHVSHTAISQKLTSLPRTRVNNTSSAVSGKTRK